MGSVNGSQSGRDDPGTHDSLLERGLPSDIEAEKAILGAVVLNNDLLAQALLFLHPEDFFLDSHRRVFDAMVSLRNTGNPVDTITLPRLLADRGELQQIGGITYLATLFDGVPRTDTIEYYCRIISYKSRERETIRLLNKAVDDIVDGEQELDALLEQVESRLSRISQRGSAAKPICGVYPTLDDFFAADIKEPEQILFGAHRGEVAGLLAMTNYGKSTALLNATLSIAAGDICWPLAPIVPMPRRVLYVDSESPAARAKADLQKMIHGVSNASIARENFVIVVDGSINGEPLNLSRAEHLNWVMGLAKTHRIDLVIIDTAASAFELHDENNNAEVTRRVMNPLKRLAREANCAVIFTHHIGKANETQTGEAAYRGRGASAFGALSRTIFTIEKDAKKGPEYIILSCGKVKGQPFEPVLLKLNHETRWFEMCYESPSAKPEPPTAKEIADFVKEKKEARTEDIKNHFAGRGSARTISDRIADAERLGLIMKSNKQAPWRMCNEEIDQIPLHSEVIEKSTDEENVQCATPIRDCTFAHSSSNGGSDEVVNCPSCGAAGLIHSHCTRCEEFLRGNK